MTRVPSSSATTRTKTSLDVTRECGACSFCCKVMAIDELKKPNGQWCEHRCSQVGCSIYRRHPASCKSFACQWLLEPTMPHRFRPDRSKVVLVYEAHEARLVAHCDPSNPLAWLREPIFSLLKQQARSTWYSNMHVVAKAGRKLWLITPTEQISLGEVHERSPIEIIKSRDGSAEVIVLPTINEGADIEDHLIDLRTKS